MEIIQYSLDITPSFEVTLSGFGQIRKTSSIHNALEMNIIVFFNKSSTTIIITIDTLFITNKVYNEIFKIFKSQLPDLEKKDLIISSSHTHYAPSLEDTRTDLGAFDTNYFNFMVAKLNDNILNILNTKRTTIELKVTTEKTSDLICNRRRKIIDYRRGFRSAVVLEPNESGPSNKEIYLIKIIESNTQKVVSLIWSFACHPTNLPEKKIISSEYIGAVRSHIRNKIFNDPTIAVLFLQGFAGDVRAAPPKERNQFKYKIYKLLRKSYPESLYRFNWKEYEKWTESLCYSIENILKNKNYSNSGHQEIKTKLNEFKISTLGISVDNVETFVVRQLELSDNVLILFLSAEVLSEYYQILKQIWPDKMLIPAGYIENIFGYLPTEKVILDGGYEAKDFFKPFKVKGQFIPNIEHKISECLIQTK